MYNFIFDFIAGSSKCDHKPEASSGNKSFAHSTVVKILSEEKLLPLEASVFVVGTSWDNVPTFVLFIY